MSELVASFCLVFGCQATATTDILDIPKKALPYVDILKTASNPSRESAQTEQESNWNPLARSPYAKGLRQFTDRTGKQLSKTLCRDLGAYKPFNPTWSLKCGIRYQESLQSTRYGGYCNNRKIAEQRYNGGYWVIWELNKAKTSDLKIARRVCGTKLNNGRRRAYWACRENYEYPVRISKKQPKYESLGGKICN